MARNPKNKPEDDFEVPGASPSGGGFEIDTTGWSMPDRSVPPGDYRAVLLDVERQTSKAGKPMLVWTFSVVEPGYGGQELRTYTVLEEQFGWKLNEVLRATNLGKVGQRLTFKYHDFINTLVILRLETEEYQDQKRSTIRRVMPPPEGAGTKYAGALPDADMGSSIGVPSGPSDDGAPF